MSTHHAEPFEANEPGRARWSGRLGVWAAMAVLLTLALLAAQAYATSLPSAQVVDVGAGDQPAVQAASPEFQRAQLPHVVAGDECYTRSDDASFLVGTLGIAPSVSGFDAALGTLRSVSVETSAFITSKGWARNDSVGEFEFYIETGRGFVAAISGPGIIGSAVTDYSSESVFLPANTDTSTPGVQHPIDLISAVDSDVASPSDLSEYTAATVSFPVSSGGSFLLNLPSDGGSEVKSFVNVTVAVTYCYTPVVVATSTITITSTVELGGSTGVPLPTTNYDIACTNGFSGTASILGTGSGVVDIGIADPGTSCTVTQTLTSPAQWSTTAQGACGVTATIDPNGTAAFANVLAGSPSDPC